MPDPDNLPPAPSKTRPCRICCEPIATGASKCIHCNSFQDWRRYLQFSTTVLSLLVALVSVLTVAIPVIVKTLHVDNSRVRVDFQTVTSLEILLITTNSGSRPGGLGKCTLQVDGLFPKAQVVTLGFAGGGASFFPPATSAQTRLYLSGVLPAIVSDEFTKKLSDASCVLSVEAIQFNGKKNVFTFKHPASV